MANYYRVCCWPLVLPQPFASWPFELAKFDTADTGNKFELVPPPPWSLMRPSPSPQPQQHLRRMSGDMSQSKPPWYLWLGDVNLLFCIENFVFWRIPKDWDWVWWDGSLKDKWHKEFLEGILKHMSMVLWIVSLQNKKTTVVASKKKNS